MTLLNRFAEPVYCILRLIVGLLFACHGGQKLFGLFGGPAELNDPEGLVGGIIEFGAGILVALGLVTRVAAILASGEMAVAYFKAHAMRAWFPIQNHGELAVLFCWIFLFVFFYGAGRYSLDFLIKPKTLT